MSVPAQREVPASNVPPPPPVLPPPPPVEEPVTHWPSAHVVLPVHALHAAPFAPHAKAEPPLWHTPAASQQPAHVLAHGDTDGEHESHNSDVASSQSGSFIPPSYAIHFFFGGFAGGGGAGFFAGGGGAGFGAGFGGAATTFFGLGAGSGVLSFRSL